MDEEYLSDYEQREYEENNLFLKKIKNGSIEFRKDRYPPDNRFIKIKEPIASATSYLTISEDNLWAQIPFCGSLIAAIPPVSKQHFEKFMFKVSDIPKIITFIKETGRLQIILNSKATDYIGLDYLDPFFNELRPPMDISIPLNIFGTNEALQEASTNFHRLGNVNYLKSIKEQYRREGFNKLQIKTLIQRDESVYEFLKLGKYNFTEEIENLMNTEPIKARELFRLCNVFIFTPAVETLNTLHNYALEDIKKSQYIPSLKIKNRFPCEIGKILLKKLTYAPEGIRACNYLIDEFNSYDLHKLLESLNNGIIENNPDIINKNAEELSTSLDNVWNDKTIPRRIKGLKFGLPISMAIIGSPAGPLGAASGFLTGLGFDIVGKFFEFGSDTVSEKIAKLRTKSYQSNIYDFKKKYTHKIVKQ
jgi:hypothetical protein